MNPALLAELGPKVEAVLAMAGEVASIIAPTAIADPLDSGATRLSWASPVTVATVNAVRQPVSTEALERAGLTAKVGQFTVYCDPTEASPEMRVRMNSNDYLILDVRHWQTHTELVVELLGEVAGS